MLRALRITGGFALMLAGAWGSVRLLPQIELLPAFLGVLVGGVTINAPRLFSQFREQRDHAAAYIEARPDADRLLERDERDQRIEIALYLLGLAPLGLLIVLDVRPHWVIALFLVAPIAIAFVLTARRAFAKIGLQINVVASTSANPARFVRQQWALAGSVLAIVFGGVALTADDPVRRDQLLQLGYALGILLLLCALIWRLVMDRTEKR